MKPINPLESILKLFEYYQSLGQRTLDQVSDEGLFWQSNPASNSIAVIVKHLHGNMMSRWTDFLTADGEKEWRQRDGEFKSTLKSKAEMQNKYDEGWQCLFDAISPLKKEDLGRIVYIRNMGHTVLEALHRQLAHYAYHIGQMVYIGKQIQDENWQTLSIAPGASIAYNKEKFGKDKTQKHFTEDL